MGLISYSTGLHPFRDNPYQEAAIVPIVRYMAEHDPPMQIDRQGYRAVIRIQLAQRKTPTEQQWAGLKALSWPPWKSDRTAMDATITLDHGISSAGQTLARMGEAGYRMLNWEKCARVYAGWDVDKTPTIQMRALLQQASTQVSSGIFSDHYIPWAARIDSTRTIQEAWACYLAWEDLKLPHDQLVYLAIMGKLYGEEKRQRFGDLKHLKNISRPRWALLPGDTPDVSPLPPSTHLFTYTRTSPPSMEDFYVALKERGVIFQDHCLGFLVRHAPSLQSGLDRLRHSCQHYPELQHVLLRGATEEVSKLPLPVFRAVVELYTRFARVPMHTITEQYRKGSTEIAHDQMGDRLHLNNSMARAIHLLQRWPNAHPLVLNVVLRGLTREANLPSLRHLILNRQHASVTDSLAHHVGAVNAYQVMESLMKSLQAQRIQLDAIGFGALCKATENVAVAAWVAVQDDPSAEYSSQQDGKDGKKQNADSNFRQHVLTVVNDERIYKLLKDQFGVLTTASASEGHERASRHPRWFEPTLPRLFTIPDPAILHAYIRALGWLADYNGLHHTICWMREYRAELAERRGHNRLGDEMTRKAIVALRVFLERGWLDQEPTTEPAEDLSTAVDTVSASGSLLQRFRTPASVELVEKVRLVVQEVEEWEGWPSDEEVMKYAADKRFQQVR